MVTGDGVADDGVAAAGAGAVGGVVPGAAVGVAATLLGLAPVLPPPPQAVKEATASAKMLAILSLVSAISAFIVEVTRCADYGGLSCVHLAQFVSNFLLRLLLRCWCCYRFISRFVFGFPRSWLGTDWQLTRRTHAHRRGPYAHTY